MINLMLQDAGKKISGFNLYRLAVFIRDELARGETLAIRQRAELGIFLAAGAGEIGHQLGVDVHPEDGTVWAWGAGWSGVELMQYSAPVQLGGMSGIVAVAGGWNHTLALKAVIGPETVP